jgi:hypothetical protein
MSDLKDLGHTFLVEAWSISAIEFARAKSKFVSLIEC